MWKLAEMLLIKEITGEKPVLLLDDVMSELDVDRRSRLLDFLNGQQIQTFITATDAAYFPKNSNAKFYIISNGKLDNFN